MSIPTASMILSREDCPRSTEIAAVSGAHTGAAASASRGPRGMDHVVAVLPMSGTMTTVPLAASLAASPSFRSDVADWAMARVPAGPILGDAVKPGPGATRAVEHPFGVDCLVSEESLVTAEDVDFWREHHCRHCPGDDGRAFEDLAPAYGYGTEAFRSRRTGRFEDNEERVQHGWEKFKGTSRLSWEQAKEAVQQAWYRLESGVPANTN